MSTSRSCGRLLFETLLVDFTVTGEDFGDAQRRLVRGIRGGPVAIRRPIRIAEGTLVIDIFRRDDTVDRDPVWRGVIETTSELDRS
jgi:hypothetical protein